MSLIGYRLLKMSDKAAHYGASDIVFSLETRPMAALRAPATVSISPFRRLTGKRSGSLRKQALANGGADEGAPGIRENYNANYYGAFVRDLDGNKIEVVTFTAKEKIAS